jgi:hypothetical protein
MSAASVNADSSKAPQSFFDRLTNPDVTRFTLTFNFDQLEGMKNVDDYFPATFSHQGENWDANLKVRGRYRRRICDFPPLKLKLSKDMLEAAGLLPHNKFKLVTHCSDNFDVTDNVLREQLAYELYHTLTGEGFRTQLVQVTYRNATNGETIERFGILIEDTDEMAQAMGGEECDDCVNIKPTQFLAGNLEKVALFNYMIGNADYGIVMPRNIKIVQQAAGGQYRAVPYDFDFSGMVNTEYAIPNVNFQQTNIKDRVWIWEYDQAPQIDRVINSFLAKEAEVMALINNFPHLSSKSQRQVSKYLSDFYTRLKDGSFQQAI